ncbi:MAG: F0F1 ATP synthase subunit B [Defluviitaleaceae bacterium]|nr:F0F1 ATP synthase subunit B [Defluviitaleaceae bacterium]
MNQGFIFLLNAEPVPRLFDLDLQTFLQMLPALVNFIVLALVLTFILYKPVRAFLHERANRIARELDEAEATKQAAIALKEQYEQLLKGIELERTAILDDARKLAMERRSRDMTETKKEIEDLKARAGVEIAAELDRVKNMVEHAIVEISSEMAGKLLNVTIDPSIHNRLFDEAMAELEATVFK